VRSDGEVWSAANFGAQPWSAAECAERRRGVGARATLERGQLWSEAMVSRRTRCSVRGFPYEVCLEGYPDKEREWTPRQRRFAIGRIYFCGPKAGERYYLRLLLHHVTGAKSWEELRTVPGQEQPFETFREACLARGLLESDEQWDSCLSEAASIARGSGMRDLFALILTDSNPGNPLDHKENISPIAANRWRPRPPRPHPPGPQIDGGCVPKATASRTTDIQYCGT
jgi:hypothetical protein